MEANNQNKNNSGSENGSNYRIITEMQLRVDVFNKESKELYANLGIYTDRVTEMLKKVHPDHPITLHFSEQKFLLSDFKTQIEYLNSIHKTLTPIGYEEDEKISLNLLINIIKTILVQIESDRIIIDTLSKLANAHRQILTRHNVH